MYFYKLHPSWTEKPEKKIQEMRQISTLKKKTMTIIK